MMNQNLAFLFEHFDGIAYLTDEHGKLLVVPEGVWRTGYRKNGFHPTKSADLVGRTIFDMFTPGPVVETYTKLHQIALGNRERTIQFDLRCDAPTIYRKTRMTIDAVGLSKDKVGVLYRSTILDETERETIEILRAPSSSSRNLSGGPRTVLSHCSFCHSIATEQSVDLGIRDWVPLEAFSLQDRSKEVCLSHEICPWCKARISLNNDWVM